MSVLLLTAVLVLIALILVLIVVLVVVLVLASVLAVILVVLILILVLVHVGFLQLSFYGIAARIAFPNCQDLSLGRNRRLASKPLMIATVIPPALAFKPPINMPRNPFSSTASRTPLARMLPNPVKGTLAPAPANSTKG